jgi:hypothetical protein
MYKKTIRLLVISMVLFIVFPQKILAEQNQLSNLNKFDIPQSGGYYFGELEDGTYFDLSIEYASPEKKSDQLIEMASLRFPERFDGIVRLEIMRQVDQAKKLDFSFIANSNSVGTSGADVEFSGTFSKDLRYGTGHLKDGVKSKEVRFTIQRIFTYHKSINTFERSSTDVSINPYTITSTFQKPLLPYDLAGVFEDPNYIITSCENTICENSWEVVKSRPEYLILRASSYLNDNGIPHGSEEIRYYQFLIKNGQVHRLDYSDVVSDTNECKSILTQQIYAKLKHQKVSWAEERNPKNILLNESTGPKRILASDMTAAKISLPSDSSFFIDTFGITYFLIDSIGRNSTYVTLSRDDVGQCINWPF